MVVDCERKLEAGCSRVQCMDGPPASIWRVNEPVCPMGGGLPPFHTHGQRKLPMHGSIRAFACGYMGNQVQFSSLI